MTTDSCEAERDGNSIVIRQFDFPADYAAVVSLWENAGDGIQLRRSDEMEEIAKKIQRDPDLFLVAEVSSEIIGSVMGGFDGRRGMMYHLAVAEPFRRHGIGERLMEELEDRLRAKGCIRYYLLVTFDNQEAIRFYEKRGCQKMNLHAYGKNLE